MNPGPKHVLVTGGSRGLGLECCTRLLEAGYAVSTCSRSGSDAIDRLAAGSAGRLSHFRADLAVPADIGAFVDAACKAHGSPWALVNNSAVAQDGVLATLPEVEVHKMIAVDLEGAIYAARHCLRHMLKAGGGGRIVNISSIVGHRGYSGLAVYSACKAGLDGLTRSLAREVGRSGITVNSIAPGYMRTELSHGLDDAQLQQVIRRTPLGRLGTPADVAGLLVFLLSDAAEFITAQTIAVDGGLSN